MFECKLKSTYHVKLHTNVTILIITNYPIKESKFHFPKLFKNNLLKTDFKNIILYTGNIQNIHLHNTSQQFSAAKYKCW